MNQTKLIIVNATIATIYAVLTLALAPISYGPIQIRLSECLVLLAFYNKKYIPGLTIGCLLANINSPLGITDIFVGTTATLISLLLMQYLPTVFIASLAPVFINGIMIGGELAYLSEIPMDSTLLAVITYIGFGEFLSVSILGILLFKFLLKNPILRKYIID